MRKANCGRGEEARRHQEAGEREAGREQTVGAQKDAVRKDTMRSRRAAKNGSEKKRQNERTRKQAVP